MYLEVSISINSLYDLGTHLWGQGLRNFKWILEYATRSDVDKKEDMEDFLEEYFNHADITTINDFLWFDYDKLLYELGLHEDKNGDIQPGAVGYSEEDNR